jgi:capsular polysaccharide biosynthesis protein
VKWAIALSVTTVMVALAAGLVASALPPKYVSKVSLLVGPVTGDVDTLRASELLTSTYSQLLLNPSAVQEAAASVGMSADDVSEDSVVTFNTDTRIVTMTVTTGTAATSTRIASSLTRQLADQVGTVDPSAPGAVTILSVRPQTAEEVRPSATRYAILGGAGWLLLVAALLAAFATRGGSWRQTSPEESSHEREAERQGAGAGYQGQDDEPNTGLSKRERVESPDDHRDSLLL